MKTVLFAINGTWAHSSLSVRCLRTALREADLPCEIVEGTLQDRTLTLLARLCEANADLYAFSCYIWNVDEMLEIAASLHALRPRARILLGGPEVSFDSERFSALPFVDHVIAGEGEVAIVSLVQALALGETPPRLIVGENDPHFTERGIHYDKNEPVPALVYYESTRGCPFCCAFCLSSATHGVRAKTAERTLDDLAAFEELEGRFTVKLVDRTFNFDRERAKAIWRGLLSERYTKCYHFEIAADLLDEECFEILSRFPKGKIRLEIGLQSTNPKTLAAVSRHTNADAVLAASRRLVREGGGHVHLDLIAGLPHEDLASFARSFDAAHDACHVLQLGFLKFLHGTRLREDAASFGAVFESKAPYTVLCTDCLSFEDVVMLHGVSDLMERLRDSGRFSRSLAFVLSHEASPFAFYRDLSHYLTAQTGKVLQRISQRDLFALFAAFAKERLCPSEHNALSRAMRADFAASEARKPPRGI